ITTDGTMDSGPARKIARPGMTKKENRRSVFDSQTAKRGHRPAFSRHDLSELCLFVAPSSNEEGAGKPGAVRTRGPYAKRNVRTYVIRERSSNRTSPRNGLGGLCRALPGEWASLATVARAFQRLLACQAQRLCKGARTTRFCRPARLPSLAG